MARDHGWTSPVQLCGTPPGPPYYHHKNYSSCLHNYEMEHLVYLMALWKWRATVAITLGPVFGILLGVFLACKLLEQELAVLSVLWRWRGTLGYTMNLVFQACFYAAMTRIRLSHMRERARQRARWERQRVRQERQRLFPRLWGSEWSEEGTEKEAEKEVEEGTRGIWRWWGGLLAFCPTLWPEEEEEEEGTEKEVEDSRGIWWRWGCLLALCLTLGITSGACIGVLVTIL